MGRPAIATVLVPDGAEDAYNLGDADSDDCGQEADPGGSHPQQVERDDDHEHVEEALRQRLHEP